MAEDFKEAFLKANANKVFICAQFVDVLRDLIRAVAVRDDPSVPVYRAVEQWKFIIDLVQRCEEPVLAKDLFSTAVEALRVSDQDQQDDVEEAVLSAARRGMSFYMEASCTDNAARGRTSRRERDFLSAVESIDSAREHRRRRWEKERC
jgi:hypothetical protein